MIEPIFRRSFSFIDTNNWRKFEFLEKKETVVYSVEAFSRGLNFSASASQVEYLFCLREVNWNEVKQSNNANKSYAKFS